MQPANSYDARIVCWSRTALCNRPAICRVSFPRCEQRSAKPGASEQPNEQTLTAKVGKPRCEQRSAKPRASEQPKQVALSTKEGFGCRHTRSFYVLQHIPHIFAVAKLCGCKILHTFAAATTEKPSLWYIVISPSLGLLYRARYCGLCIYVTMQPHNHILTQPPVWVAVQ